MDRARATTGIESPSASVCTRPPGDVGHYRILRQLEDGAEAQSFLACEGVLGRRMTLAFLTVGPVDAPTRARIFLELRAAARVQHPNVLAVHEAGDHNGRPYVVSEHVRGQTLDQIARPLPWVRARQIGAGIARGLAAAHRLGVVHGALMPRAVLIDEGGSPKLLDLWRRARTPEDEARPGAPYRAPELWNGEMPTRRSDVYALGALIYELCAGYPPHGEIPVERLRPTVQDSEARPLVQVAPSVSPMLGKIVDRCLLRDSAARFASGEELCAALEQLGRRVEPASAAGDNPYRGLRPFDAEHRAFFFGRNLEIEALLDRLRTEPFVIVAGDSGVGKSSLCRAGILPRVAAGELGNGRSWSVVQMVPGRRPLSALTAALAGALRSSPEDLVRRLVEDPASLVGEVRRGLGGAEGLIVFVDQLEELHTNSDRAEAEICDDLLMRLAGGLEGVRVVATVRADFLTRVATLPRLGEEIGRARYLLRPLTGEKIREVVVGPAERAGVRFESDAMVDELVEPTARAEEALPLLQFALALLWESRDVERAVVTSASLARLGGVSGALARHADAVVDTLSPSQRTAARSVMTRLVTLENARARRTEEDLTCGDAVAAEALDALVRGRLVVASEAQEGSAFELSHEVLVQGWGTLAGWLREDEARRRTCERLARATAEWARLSDKHEGLWSAKQLAEIGDVEAGGLAPRERAFLAASRRALVRRARLRWAMAAMVPLFAAALWGTVEWKERRDLGTRVAVHLEEGREATHHAHILASDRARARKTAFELFDGQDRDGAEVVWAGALAMDGRLTQEQARAGRALEAALVLDGTRRDARDLLGNVLYERAALADEQHRAANRDELLSRLALYDTGGAHVARWRAPATLSVATAARPASVVLHRYEEGEGHRLVAGSPRALGESPVSVSLEPGSYLLHIDGPGRAPVNLPILLARAQHVSLDVALPEESAVPAGFVYVPEGRFLFGSTADEELRTGFFDAAPVHEARTGAYLVARNELTFGEWIDYLRALPAAERAARLPRAGSNVQAAGSIRLEELPGATFRLHLQPGSEPLEAREGEPLRYPARTRRADQAWLRLPVTGVSADDVEAFAAWLRATGRVPGARLCTELEWERAARGADDREHPHGNDLGPDDADFDLTYDRSPKAMGPDEVGAHPSSRSPFGLDDASGNALEWTTSSLASGQYVVRGGAYFYDKKSARVSNRQVTVRTLRDATVGTRMCADAPPP